MLRSQPTSRGGLGLGLDTVVFFDAPEIKRELDRRSRRMLGYYGGYARRVARSSIRRVGAARKEPQKYVRRSRRGEGFLVISPAWLKWAKEVRERPSAPRGHPPYTHTGLYKKALVYAWDRVHKSVVVGFDPRIIGPVARLHEHSGRRFQRYYPARPTVGPAALRARHRLPEFWRRSVRA